MRNVRSGFTLIELILTVSLLLLLGVLSASFTASFYTQNAVSNTTDQLINSFRVAQTDAMLGKQGSNWGVNYASGTITLYKGNSFATRVAAFDSTFSVVGSVTIAGITDDNFTRVTGLPNGFVTPQTITVTGSGETKTITINSQGVATR